MSKDLGIGRPPSKKEEDKKPKTVTRNLKKPESSALVDLNFKVSPEFRREFKMFCASNDLKQKEALEQAFDVFRKSFS